MINQIILGTCNNSFINEQYKAFEILDLAYERGITTVDVARVYGDAERNLGEWIRKRGLRDKIYIITKAGHPTDSDNKRNSIKELRSDLQESLKEMKIESVDCLLAHRDDGRAVEEIAESFNDFMGEGIIKAWGVSNWKLDRLKRLYEYTKAQGIAQPIISSPQYSIVKQVEDVWGGTVSESGIHGDEAIQWCENNGVWFCAYSPLAHGMLCDGWKKPLFFNRSNDITWRMFGSKENGHIMQRCKNVASQMNCSLSQIALAYIHNKVKL